eukprot:6031798-Amphidinium_carterae.1
MLDRGGGRTTNSLDLTVKTHGARLACKRNESRVACAPLPKAFEPPKSIERDKGAVNEYLLLAEKL